jgi:hypothetical protein
MTCLLVTNYGGTEDELAYDPTLGDTFKVLCCDWHDNIYDIQRIAGGGSA